MSKTYNKYRLENTDGTIKNGQSSETSNIEHRRWRQTKQKQHARCVGHHYTQTNTNNVNKTWIPLTTTGRKDELNIVFMRKS